MSKTIFMIHGMWGGGWCWDKFQRYFENKGYHCVAPYLRHHDIKPDAPPPPGLGKTSLLDYAGDLQLEIKTLDEKPIIMGHSMRGLLAQILASRDLAKAVVLITPASPAGIVAITWRATTEIGFWFVGVRGAQVDSSKLTRPLLIISGSEDNITPPKVV